jgi:hypothetical protein
MLIRRGTARNKMKSQKWFSRLADVFNKHANERDLSDKFESHLQLHIDDNLRAGLSPAEARRQAILKFGSVESVWPKAMMQGSKNSGATDRDSTRNDRENVRRSERRRRGRN